MNNARHFYERGWCQYPFDAELLEWVERAVPAARRTLTDPEFSRWLRYQGTWFAGVNALYNDTQGAVDDSGPLRGLAVTSIAEELKIDFREWDRGQVSICFPGYPKPMEDQSEAMFRFRRDRDAAHVDGLLPEGADRRRHLREHHAFILGIPMAEFDERASPFVIWAGSHEIVRSALRDRFRGIAPSRWGDEDITEAYQSVRRDVFERCERIEIHARPGEAFVAHRLCLHGTAPWDESASAGADGRMICYFRPEGLSARQWLEAP